MANYILSAFADEVTPVFEEQLKYLKSRGIGYIEPRNIDGTNVSSIDDNQLKEAAAKLEKYGIGVSSIGSPIGKIQIGDDFNEHMALLDRTITIAKAFGTKNIRVFSFFYPEGTTPHMHRDAVMSRLEAMLELAEKNGITLCHENEKAIYGETIEDCADIMKHFGGRFKSIVDMGNYAFCQQDPFKGYLAVKDYIEYIHIKDANFDTSIVPAGMGEGKIYEILSDYSKSTDRDVFLTLEPHLTVFSGLDKLSNLNDIKVQNAFESPVAAFDAAKEALEKILARI